MTTTILIEGVGLFVLHTESNGLQILYFRGLVKESMLFSSDCAQARHNRLAQIVKALAKRVLAVMVHSLLMGWILT